MHVFDRLIAVAAEVKAGLAGLDLAVAYRGGQIDAAAVHHRVGPTQTGYSRFPLDVLVLFGIPLKRKIFIFRDAARPVAPKRGPVFRRRRLAKREAKRDSGKQQLSCVVKIEHGPERVWSSAWPVKEIDPDRLAGLAGDVIAPTTLR